MLPTWAELMAGKTNAQVLNEMLNALKALPRPFPVDDWNEGSVPLTILDAVSRVMSRGYQSATAIARGGFLKLASETWLPVLAENKYMLTQNAPRFTQGFETFTVAPAAGPYTINGGQHILATEGGLKYFTNNTVPIQITNAKPVPIPIKAESPGAAYNVGAGQITRLVTTLPGVTVSNVPVIDIDFDGNPDTWISDYGSDIESGLELRRRCATRLGRLSKLQNKPTDGYESAARDAHPAVKKVAVHSNRLQDQIVPGCMTLYLAGDTGPVAAAVVKAVFDALNPYRCPMGTIFVASCRARPWVVSGYVEVDRDFNIPEVRNEVLTYLNDYQRESPIAARLYSAEAIERVMDATGVINFKPQNLFDTKLNDNEVMAIDTTRLVFQVASGAGA